MKFVNQTPFPADKAIGSTTDVEQLMTVAVKLTMTWDADGRLYPLPKDAWWPMNQGPAAYAGVSLAPDFDYRQRHIDLLVFGNARTPGRSLQAMHEVGIHTASVSKTYRVFGDRSWIKQGDSWKISDATPFHTMAMSNDRAYGGSCGLDGQKSTYSMNPQGRGFALNEADLEQLMLPNIERPHALISNWTDKPVPACFHKPAEGLLLSETGAYSWEALTASGANAEGGVDKALWAKVLLRNGIQEAPPDFILPRGGLGSSINLRGFFEHGDMTVALPPEVGVQQKSGPVLFVQVGAQKSAFPLQISTIVILTESRTMVLTYSASFRYGVYPQDERNAVLRWYGPTEFEMSTATNLVVNKAAGVANV